jgi:hypothetical protein
MDKTIAQLNAMEPPTPPTSRTGRFLSLLSRARLVVVSLLLLTSLDMASSGCPTPTPESRLCPLQSAVLRRRPARYFPPGPRETCFDSCMHLQVEGILYC